MAEEQEKRPGLISEVRWDLLPVITRKPLKKNHCVIVWTDKSYQ